MRIKKLSLAVAIAALSLSGMACAMMPVSNSSATLTADNEFALYTGNLTGSNLQLVGSGSDWQSAQTFYFDVSPGDYLYVAATNRGGPRGWQGVFSTPAGTIYTDSSNWLATTASSITVTPAVISSASWSATNEINTYGWGSKVGDGNAQWIWGAGTDTALFRTASAVSAVPESETYAMMLAGLGLLGFVASRRKTAKR
jgi:hypothetical protein